jgi:uncharacterized protein (TIGR02284 family)
METTEKSTEVINELIELNNDRVAGFEKVLADIKDENADLKVLFQEYSEQSRRNSQELTAIVSRYGEAETGTSVSGNLHRAWIDVKSLFGGDDRKSILAEAERGEDAIKKAYQTAISEAGLSADALSVISAQANDIIAAHDRIKALRDAA